MARITRMTKRRLGELLQAEGLISEDQVRLGLEEQRKSSLFLGEALVKLGFVSEEAIAYTIVQQFSLPFMSAMQYTVTADVLNLFPERMYYEYQFIAVDKIGKVLIIVGAGLMNHDVLDELERLSNCRVCQFVSTWKDIRGALDKYAKDLKSEQSLSSLGSMLFDSASEPTPIPKRVEAPAPAAVLAPAPSNGSFPGSKSVSVAPPKPYAFPARKSGLAAAVPHFSGPVTPPAIKAAPPPSPAGSGRVSALISTRPPPKPPDAPPASTDSGRNPPQPKSGTGLLGLFKKQQQ